jgi:ABC-type nitrate/sulfonate/bicarbonate transport system ATPase subunit
MIKLSNITVTYPSNSVSIFKNFSWEVQKTESWAVLGPSGCGKTTLLYLLSGLLQPAGGTILIDDQPILRPRPKSGLILQDYGLLPWATVQQNCDLGIKIRKYYGADGIHAPTETRSTSIEKNWLQQLGLDKFADKYPSQLSGGQRQRVAIARTLNLQPDLLMMDEPFSSLDVPTRESLQDLTTSLVTEQDLTLILVTHSIEEAVLLGRKILLLGDPPNEDAMIIDNSESARLNYRNSNDYSKQCKVLRAKMGASS